MLKREGILKQKKREKERKIKNKNKEQKNLCCQIQFSFEYDVLKEFQWMVLLQWTRSKFQRQHLEQPFWIKIVGEIRFKLGFFGVFQVFETKLCELRENPFFYY